MEEVLQGVTTFYVITNRSSVVFCISSTLEYAPNGNPIVEHGAYSIMKSLIGNIYSGVINIPEDYEDNKYLFNGETWKINPDYREEASTETK